MHHTDHVSQHCIHTCTDLSWRAAYVSYQQFQHNTDRHRDGACWFGFSTVGVCKNLRADEIV